MACAIAACMYSIPEDIAKKCDELLTDDLREIKDKYIDLVSERGNNKNKLFGWFG